MIKFLKNNITQIILIILFVAVYSNIFDIKLDLNGDNFQYLLLSKALVQGKGYVSTVTGVNTPTDFYPPGYPSILAFFRIFFGSNIIAFKIINGLFLLLSVLILSHVSKALTNKKVLFFSVSILILTNIHLLRFSTMIMSEMSFLLFSALSFYFIYKLPAEKNFLKSPYFYLLIISITTSYYIRQVGIVMLIATIIYYLINKHWKLALSIFSGFIILYLPWQLRNSHYGIKSRYLGTVMTVNPWRPEEGNIGTFKEFFEKMVSNFDETVIKGFIDALFPFAKINYRAETSITLLVLSLIVLGITFFGAFKMGKFKFLFPLYLLGNIGIFLLWHGGNGLRYVVPLIPFIFIGFYNGISEILILFSKNEKLIRGFEYAIILVFLLSLTPIKNLAKINSQDYPKNFQNYVNIAKSIKINTPKNTIVCGRKPAILHYYSERPSFNYKYSINTDEVIADLAEKNINYVILDQLGYSSTGRYLYPAIKANPTNFKTTIHLKDPDTYLLEFIKNPETNNQQKQ